MAKFPTYEELGRRAAEYALDDYEYRGKTFREWVELILRIPNDDEQDRVIQSLRIHGNDSGSCNDGNGTKCAYKAEGACSETLCRDAADMLERLIADNSEKSAEMMLLTRDRDDWKRRAEAAINELRGFCRLCKHYDGGEYVSNECMDCARSGGNWEWRGPVEEGKP